MDSTALVVAVVSAVGVVTAALITSMRRENRDDHDLVTEQISAVYRLLNRIGDKLDRHLDWHHEGNTDGNTETGNRRQRKDGGS